MSRGGDDQMAKKPGSAEVIDQPPTEVTPDIPTRVVWDDTAMLSSFANVINVINTREEFTLLFGTNQTWNVVGSKELTVKLSNRIVLTPYAAKRLVTLLQQHVADYEGRFGQMRLEG
jgi:hypothetical protein